MRLLTFEDDGKIKLTKHLVGDIPPYAILSHTWGSDDDEVTLKDIEKGTARHKNGYRKIKFCGEQAASHGLHYFWVDSCCIDKSNNTELSQAINSMFRWYRNAFRCYVYLSDVSKASSPSDKPDPWESAIRQSRWFTRGWTLQELIAPSSVEFFSVDGVRLGDKKSLERQLHEITGVAIAALRGSPLSDFSRRERMLWAANRTTTIEEDRAYSLLGIFDVYLPPIYGEGIKHALRRLEEEIDRKEEFERGRLRDHQLPKPESSSMTPFNLDEVEKACVRSLWFPRMNIRRMSLEKPVDQTCLWLFENDLYQNWLLDRNREKHHGLLFLKGKPGAGKSVLMKEAFRQAVLDHDQSDSQTAAFFFNAKGDELEKSPLGLFRSLLYQLLPRDSEQLRRFRAVWDERNSAWQEEGVECLPWLETELRSFFQSMFTHQRVQRTIIFIDALDECDPTHIRPQALFWQQLTRAAYKANVHLNVCISTRDFPHITVPRDSCIFVEAHNCFDIETYVKQKFALSITDREPKWELLQQKILEKSYGIFLWVVLVVEDVLKKWDDGESIRSLLGQLDYVPCHLNDLFSQMFLSPNSHAVDLTRRVFQWAILATKPLRLHEWHHIMAFIKSPVPSSLKEWRKSDNFTMNDDQLEKQIKKISKGLIEVKTIRDDVHDESILDTMSIRAGAGSLNLECGETRIVQVIHESVREFFLQNQGFFAVDSNIKSDPIGYGHLSIMGTCLDYINIKELDSLVRARNIVAQRKIRSPLPVSGSYSAPEIPAGVGKSEASSNRASSLKRLKSHDTNRAHGIGAAQYRSPRCDTEYSHTYPEDPASPSDERKRRKVEQALSPKVVDDSSDLMDVNVIRWLKALPIGMCATYPSLSDESALHAHRALSVTGQTQVLEDYTALLSYATSELFTHAQRAEHQGVDLSPIIDRLMEGDWDRWVTLREDVPQGVKLFNYAVDHGLFSWTSCDNSQPDILHRNTSPVPEPGRRNDKSPQQTEKSRRASFPDSLPQSPETIDTKELAQYFLKRARSIASFSSASSHIGDTASSAYMDWGKPRPWAFDGATVDASKIDDADEVLETEAVPDVFSNLRIFCNRCNEYPKGFREEFLFRAHLLQKHPEIAARWICIHPSVMGMTPRAYITHPLDQCKSCKALKQYPTMQSAAAHLRRSHFRENPFDEKGSSSRAMNRDRPFVHGVGTSPPLWELRKWVKEIYVKIKKPNDAPHYRVIKRRLKLH